MEFLRPVKNYMTAKLESKSGQSLILALSIMFILVFLGTVFVTLLGRNLRNAVRSGDVLIARQMAEAGIRYADKMLTYSEEGADWRPVPDMLEPTVHSAHPDIKWLRPYYPEEVPIDYVPTGPDDLRRPGAGPSGGFTSFESGNGRFLLRVSYNPDVSDPMSKYIKIESIGRVGAVVSNFEGSGTPDPTTYATSGPVRLRHELTAYKPIGITDYVRFITNKEKRTDPVSFGRAPSPARMTFGGRFDGEDRTGPIRVNGNLVWRGEVDIYLRGAATANPSVVIPADGVEVAGEILHESSDTNVRLFTGVGADPKTAKPTRQNGQIRNPSTGQPVLDTFQGFYRDGVEESDASGFARSVKRLEPPLVDLTDPASNISRYRRLTRDSGREANFNGRLVNSGRYGYGRGIYINNPRDVQAEGSSLFAGGPGLASEWTQPNNKGNWYGNYYVPPGAVVRINPDATLTITRTGTVRGGAKFAWMSYDDSTNPPTLRREFGLGPTITLPYPLNGVLFAEGNIRVSGVVAAGRQLTIVSNENIYIEGSIIKADRETSAVSLLARKNIVLNTTQFLNVPPFSRASSPVWESVTEDGRSPYAYRVSASPDSYFRSDFVMGFYYPPNGVARTTAADYPAWADGSKIHLFLRHGASGQSAVVNLFVNRQASGAWAPCPWDSPGGTLFNYLMDNASTQFAPIMEAAVIPLELGVGGPAVDDNPLAVNSLAISLSQYGAMHTRGDYLLEKAAILPMDIVVQALCYAQEGSFFVIPGPWFNSNPEDTRDNFRITGRRPAYVRDIAFPFYGEALDIKITIEGAVSENLPAADGYVAEWLSKWANIPAKYGASNEDTAHSGEGISFVYDWRLGYPVSASGPIRTDGGGEDANKKWYPRALPVTPKLPVSTDLLYVGRLSG